MPTTRQQEVLDAIKALSQEAGFPPTARELAERVGLWPSAVHRVLQQLREEGLVSWEDNRARTLVVNDPPTSDR